MKTLLIHPKENLIKQTISFLEGDEKDYSSNLIVFPGRRPAHFLRKELARMIGTSYIPPVIFSIDEFVDYAFERTQLKKKLETIDAVSILYEIHKQAETILGDKRFLTPDSFFPIGLKIYRDLEELFIEGINTQLLKSIQPYIDETIPVNTIKRLQSMSYFYEEFYKKVELCNFSTRAVRYRAVSQTIDKIDHDNFRVMIFAGFFALTRCEQTIFKKLLSLDKSLFIFQDGPGIKEKLDALGIRAESREIVDHEPRIFFYQSPDTHGQVYALSNIIGSKMHKKESLNEHVTIVLPSSDTLFPLLRQGLPVLSEEQYNISLGYPLSRTPIFGFINNLMELITSMDKDRFYISDYLKFVLHPYTKNIYFNGNAEVTRIMFHGIEEQLLKNRTKTFLTLSEIEEDENILSHIVNSIPLDMTGISNIQIKKHLGEIHQNTINKFIQFNSLEDFAIKCIDLLIYIYNNSTARLHPMFYPFSESFMRFLDMLSKSIIRSLSFAERDSYFIFFRKYIATCHSPFEGTPVKGLQVLGFLETRAILFDTVFLLDANEEILPNTRKEDTLLPHKARQILGLPTYQDRDNLTAYYFHTLIKGAQEVHLFYCENDKKEKSRFVERLIWEKQKKDGTTDDKKYMNFIQYKVNLEHLQPRDIKKTHSTVRYLQDFTYSSTALDSYLKCPLQFYYSFVLRINKRAETSGEIEKEDIGKLVHRILSEFFAKRTGKPLRTSDLAFHDMEQISHKLFEQSYGKNVTGSLYLLKKQVVNHMTDFLKSYYLPLVKKESVTVLRTEYNINCRIGTHAFKGRLDSIERRNKNIYIIDYKTGSNPRSLKINYNNLDFNNRESWNDAVGSLQLPFYILLYSHFTTTKIRYLNGMFLFLGKTRISSDIEFPLFENQNQAEKTYGLLQDIIMKIIDEIKNPSIPFTPPDNKKAVCPSCNFQYICGTQWIVRR